MKKLKNLPLGESTFRDIINSNKLYIDKTKEIYNLFKTDGKYYFLSRPRRFGKSLLISTLFEIFSGNKELFKDLWIYDKIEWKKYLIIHIDFSNMLYTHGTEGFEKSLFNTLKGIGEKYNIQIERNNYKDYFNELIIKLGDKEKVVILIDEYDKPIINFIENLEIARQNREILKNFYETIKANDKYIKFVLLTGVSKFSKASVFSGLNNLNDITIDDSFSNIMGYTQEELEYYFKENIKSLANKFQIKTEELLYEIKKWYNGYSWNGQDFLYNPYSILSLFVKNEFGNYWFTSGTPTFLIKIIKEKDIDIKYFENLETVSSLLESFEIENIDIYSLLFQTGYITIKEVIRESMTSKKYILSYPNLEVKESLLNNILKSFTEKYNSDALIWNIKEEIEKNNLEKVFDIIKSIYSSIPNQLIVRDKEAYYHSIFYIILSLLGTKIQAEINTNIGRIDAVIHTKERIFILEFKIGKAEDGLKQIEDKQYYEKYFSSGKKITLIGIGFNKRKKNIGDYIVKEL